MSTPRYMHKRATFVAPLRHRPFRRVLIGHTLSGLGDWLDFFALVVLVTYGWRMGPGALAAVAIAAAAPWAVIGPAAGVLADRLPPRVTLVGSDLARAAIVFGLVFAQSLPVLLALVAAKVCFSTLFSPAQQIVVKRTVPEEDLLAANALSTFVNQSTKVIGPALGGLLVGAFGPRWAFGVDAVTFLLSAAVLSQLSLSKAGSAGGAARRRSFRSEFAEGISFISRSSVLLMAVGGMTATMFLVFAFDTLSPLALKELGADPSLLGLAMACVGGGAAIGTVLVGQWGQGIRPLGVMGASQAGAGAVVAGLGVALVSGTHLAPPVLMLSCAMIGTAFAGLLVAYPYVLQRATPPDLMGRVSATAGALPTVMQLLAPPLGAALAIRYGVGWVLVSGGAGLAMVGGVLLAARTGAAPGATVHKREIRYPAMAEAEVVAHIDTAGETTTATGRGGPRPDEGIGERRASFFW